MELHDVQRFEFPERAADFLQQLFRVQGRRGAEGVCLLAGTLLAPDRARLDTLAVPAHDAFVEEGGCGLVIEGASFTRIGHEVAQRGKRICGIIHSHPSQAFHSPVDDESPMMRFHGALSIVVPDFGAHDRLLRDAAAYRFDVHKPGWTRLSPRLTNHAICIVRSAEMEVLDVH